MYEAYDMEGAVRQFHLTYGQPAEISPRALPQDRVGLRLDLILEELVELEEALLKGDAVETYDALIDILYVTIGTGVETGMNLAPGFREVHRSNMSKLGEDGKPIKSRGMELDGFPAGKILKGPGYFKPDLKAVLDKLGYVE